ncbi:MAG: SDR family NAD(P)-dependent oxidoreductase [Deltaproteobacteria bacterium]|nr:SDR family NAD(P)-dependent oxidoreductase [Deltaproteobacteria bacterium]
MSFDIAGKVVLITGGSRGLGLVMARQLVAQRARVAICARDPEELGRAKRDLGEVLAIPCDVTQPEQLARLVGEVTHLYGPIDCLINNAGVIQVGPMKHMTIEDYEHAMATHFWAPLRLTLAVLPAMLERGEGRIVNIASIGGKIAVPHLLPYTASKFALVGLSEGMRAELAKDKVRVTTVIPGLMRTGSPPNALFKGRNEAEYVWFAAGDSSHLTAMQAERAARQILTAMRHGRPEITLTVQAKLATRLFALAPNLMQRVLALVDRWLPKPGGIGEASALGIESRRGPSLLTRASDRASLRNNEV